jgi:hypothetical protein
MSEFTLFTIEVTLSLVTSGFVIYTLSDALYHLILELCGTEARAKFWISYLNVMLVITPLLTVFIFGKSGMVVDASFSFLKNALSCILSGMFVSLGAIGFQIMQTIPKNNGQINNFSQAE